MMNRFIIKLHRILGTLLSMLFLMWFLSGLVMIYHTFPRLSVSRKIEKQAALDNNLPSLQQLLSAIAIPSDSIQSLSVEKQAGKTSFTLKTASDEIRCYADSNRIIPYTKVNPAQLSLIAAPYSQGEIASVDSINAIDVWIPYSRMKKDMPVYKFHFASDKKETLYLSSRTGDALQLTDKDSRFWAWLGPIPHWVYVVTLRDTNNGKAWVDTVLWLSGFCCFACLFGIIVGIRVYYRNWKRSKTIASPYKKPVYKWHHITGFVFGLFVLTWMFSGYMSLQKVPEWIVPVHHQSKTDTDIQGGILDPSGFHSDYRQLVRSCDSIKRIEWVRIGNQPLYKVYTDNTTRLMTVSGSYPRLFTLDKDFCKKLVQAIHPENNLSAEEITAYDNHYISRKKALPLPVYRVQVDNKDRSAYYIEPQTGYTRYYNNNTRMRHFLYMGLHTLYFPWMANHTLLWSIMVWILMIGGTACSATGVWLGFKYIKRKSRRKKRQE